MAWKIPLAEPVLGKEEEDAVRAVVASGWLTMGERTAELERRLGEALGSPRVLAVTNCTAALHLAYLAVGVGPGDEVICPSLTFVATANAALAVGATVVLADVVGENDLCVDPVDVERKIGPRTKAISVVHYGGYPCDMDALGEIAGARGIALVEDAAHAPLASWRGRALGTIGDVGCFSFFSNKNMTTGEGGAVASQTDELHQRLRLLRSHGMTTLTLDRHKGHAFSYDVLLAGHNYRIDEMRSALGIVQLGRLPELNARRRALVERYRARLDSRLVVPFRDFDARGVGEPGYHLMVVLLPEGTARQGVMERLKALGIQTSIHYPPIHHFSHHRESAAVRTELLPRTDALASRLLTLPLYPGMKGDDVDEVCAALAAAL